MACGWSGYCGRLRAVLEVALAASVCTPATHRPTGWRGRPPRAEELHDHRLTWSGAEGYWRRPNASGPGVLASPGTSVCTSTMAMAELWQQ